MKKFLSLVLALVMTMSLVTISAGAKDFTDKSSITYGEAVSVISAIGVVDGYTDGSFNPSATLTRGAAAKIICNLMLGSTTAGALTASSAPYSDVPTSNVFAGYIAYCAQQGIISGYADGTFRPAATLTSFAFMKMLLGALGYDAEIEGYSVPNWQINVAKQALAIGMDDGLATEFNGNKPVTREEAALYAFNMLQADLVEYDSKTTISVGGAEVTVGGSVAKAMRWNNSATADGNIEDDGYIQFAEQYFNKLDKIETTDAFARPATKWTYKGDKIGTYADKADATYTDNVKLGTIYADLGMSQKDAEAEVYFNGVPATNVAVSKSNTVKISTDGGANSGLTKKGSTVEVFYDDDNNDVRICLIDTYVGEIASKESNVADPYVVVNAHSSITNKAGGAVTFSGNLTHYECDTDAFDEDDVVLFTYSQKDSEIKSVVKAESVEGTVTKYTSTKKLSVNDAEYDYSKNIAFSFGAENNMNTGDSYVIYLDANGYVIYVDEQEFDATDYAFVLNAQTASAATFGKDRAALITAAGKLITVDTDDDYTASGTNLIGKIVTYRENSSGKYVLRAAPASGQINNGGTLTDGAIVNGSGSNTFYLKNSSAKIYLDNGNGTPISYAYTSGQNPAVTVNNANAGTTSKSVYANSETVFVVKDGASSYSAYTGVKNVPTIYAATANGASAQAVPFWGYVRGNNVLAFAFIDATNARTDGGKSDVIFLAAKESVSKKITDSDNNVFYTYNAVVDGEIKTVSVLATQASGSALAGNEGDDSTNYVFQNVQYNSDGFIKKVDNVNASNYDTLTATGIWKLSGSYTVGLNGASASASTRYTVATDAKIFKVDTDGNITKVDGASNITSDSTAQVIALLDLEDGDLAYIFIQEVDNGKAENGTNVVVNTLTGLTASYSRGSVSLSMTGTNAGQKYTVALKLVVAGVTTDMGTYTVTGTANTTSDSLTVTLPSVSGGVYTVTCGGLTSVVSGT